MKTFKYLILFSIGCIFGFGLIISGMSNPINVINFLNFVGNWNPSLLIVMCGAIPVSFFGFRWIEKKHVTIFNEQLHLPGTSHINKELIIGSLLFGIGWALSGFCPGPALVALGSGSVKALFFVLAMLVGIFIHDYPFKTMMDKSKIN
jgi:hypothetical protein